MLDDNTILQCDATILAGILILLTISFGRRRRHKRRDDGKDRRREGGNGMSETGTEGTITGWIYLTKVG
jgi:hypothetical protein